jgi:ribosomal protein S18 acetylase RimI-like enzyme
MLRSAGIKDYAILRKLNDEVYVTDNVSDKTFREVLKNPAWIIEDDGVLVASLMSEIYQGQPYIFSVVTAASHRGRGLATTLIKEFEKHYQAAGYDRVWLHVKVENPAQKLYFDLGYRVASFEANIYAKGVHGLVMRKRFA